MSRLLYVARSISATLAGVALVGLVFHKLHWHKPRAGRSSRSG